MKYMCFGLCCARCRIDSFPSPVFPDIPCRFSIILSDLFNLDLPPVIRMTFPERSGISFEGSYFDTEVIMPVVSCSR